MTAVPVLRSRAAVVLATVAWTFLAAPPAAAAPPQPQSFTLTVNLADPDQPGIVQADGPISGPGIVFAAERDTGHAFHETETFVFAAGTLAVSAHGITTGLGFDPATCTEQSSFKGNFSITGGTGDFAGARGHGHFSGHTTLMFTPDPASPDGCDFEQLSGSINGEAHGTVRL